MTSILRKSEILCELYARYKHPDLFHQEQASLGSQRDKCTARYRFNVHVVSDLRRTTQGS